jgi:hypothetical protein
MYLQRLQLFSTWRASAILATLFLTTVAAFATQNQRSIFVLTSTNSASGNAVVVFRLNTAGTPSLALVGESPTGGNGGASTNAGVLQFKSDLGAVANYGSNTVTQLIRRTNSIAIGKTINLAPDCTNPDSVALSDDYLFVVGATCAESHAWPSGRISGSVVTLTDPSAAQIAVGKSWAAVTLSSGSLLQLPLTGVGEALSGASYAALLPPDADTVPLGAAFWGDLLGFTPAHSVDSFAIVDQNLSVFPIVGPAPAYPTNAPCWVAKGPGNIWYTGNSPGQAISIFFSDSQGGTFYKSLPLPGSPTDVTVSADRKWLAVIYSANSSAYVEVFAIDSYGDLTPFATSDAVGASAFNGVAISE